MRSRLREIWLLVAGALACGACGACGVAMTACSAPASEASPMLANALTGHGSSLANAGYQKARSLETPKEMLVGETHGRCAHGMVEIDGPFCIDRYEASLVDVLPNGEERAHSPFTPVDRATRVRAVTAANVFPQGYISALEAERACSEAGKRLCRVAEWSKACRGPEPKSFGYGERREPGRCNDRGRNPVIRLYGRGHWTWATMNEPRLNQLDDTLARTAEHDGCTNGYGVYDMVGNLHEWVADQGGAFYGGYYQDVASAGHGEGCGYRTTAHETRYHDYSTGFRCCADVAGASAPEIVSAPTPAPAPRAKPSRGKRPRKKR